MAEYINRFKSCGRNVRIADDVYIEHPEVMELGDNVTLARGFHMVGQPQTCRFGSDVTFFNNCYIEGSSHRFVIDDHVAFYPNTYISLGRGPTSSVEVGHHSHFAPACVLYGAGGLRVGSYCNIATNVVFATVGHDPDCLDQPMALSDGKAGPITLEEDVWIAANCTITADTTIAKGCVIAANAVITKDTKPMGVYGGVPAQLMWDRREQAARLAGDEEADNP